MSRVYLGGYGAPLLSEALPDPSAAEDLPPTILNLTTGDWDKTDYEGLGYTHFEAWCIGAAGGRGGDSTTRVDYTSNPWSRPSMSDDDWDLAVELQEIYDAQGGGNGYVAVGWSPVPVTIRQNMEHDFPSHNPFYVTTYTGAILLVSPEGMGGAGGGGGLHHVVGLLSDLSTLTPVVVGQAGSDAGYGQVHTNGYWTPIPTTLTLWDPANTRLKELNNWSTNFQFSYPNPRTSFLPPQDGGHGGASTFNGSTVQASGGRGGNPGKIWNGSAWVTYGVGGDGGMGGRTIAGGGGAGSTSGVAGARGVLDGDIGQGGGGGRGGSVAPPTATVIASNGGDGSYSFADTDVYGPGQDRSGYIGMTYTVDRFHGTFTAVPKAPDSNVIVPGGGGGAHPTFALKYGSHAPGYSPNGAVILRLLKIV